MTTAFSVRNVFFCCCCLLLTACATKKETFYEPVTAAPPATPLTSASPETVYFVYTDGQFVESKLDKEPQSRLGETEFHKSIYMTIKYPAEARKNRIQGTVLVTLVVDALGELENIFVGQGIGAGCDESALESVQLAAQHGFEPAIKDGKPVKVKFSIPVKFKLEQ